MWKRADKVKLNDAYKQLIVGQISTALTTEGASADFITMVTTYVSNYLDKMIAFECHLIGRYPVDEYGELININSIVAAIAYDNIFRYMPTLMQLYTTNKKFIFEDGKIKRSHENTSNGTTRAANELSPITSAPINSAPTGSTEWNLQNPSSKSGSQYDSEGSGTETVDDPNEQRKAIEYNFRNNIYLIVRDLCDHLIDEKMSVH